MTVRSLWPDEFIDELMQGITTNSTSFTTTDFLDTVRHIRTSLTIPKDILNPEFQSKDEQEVLGDRPAVLFNPEELDL